MKKLRLLKPLKSVCVLVLDKVMSVSRAYKSSKKGLIFRRGS